MTGLDGLRDEAARRLGERRLAHVASVAETAAKVASAFSTDIAEGSARAAWIHDAWKEETFEEWIRVIESAGEVPDPWSARHAPHLLHADAAAAWARFRGEPDPAVLDAVRHHPTGHPGWGPVGRILFVADFCEPTREYAAALDTAALVARAGEGAQGLAEASRNVLSLRLRWLVERDRPVHPRSWEAWNTWLEKAES